MFASCDSAAVLIRLSNLGKYVVHVLPDEVQ